MLDETCIETALGRALGVPIAAALAASPLDVELLTEAERRRHASVRDTPRCDSWLRGRAALKRLLTRIGESPDTAELEFPHARVSLTHCGRYAMAVAADARARPCALPRRAAVTAGDEPAPYGVPAMCGLGVDMEIGRVVPDEAARFFLSAAERARLPSAAGSELLRLWTVKEAVFKADLHNDCRGLLDYQLADARAAQGVAHACAELDIEIRYVSIALPGGFLSAAVAHHRTAGALA